MPVQIHFLFKCSHFETASLSKKTITNLSNLILAYNMETGQKETWNTLWELQQFSEKKKKGLSRKKEGK